MSPRRAQPRVVWDTSLMVSDRLVHRLPLARLIDMVLAQERFTLVSAPELLEELARVLGYPRLQRYYDATRRGLRSSSAAWRFQWR